MLNLKNTRQTDTYIIIKKSEILESSLDFYSLLKVNQKTENTILNPRAKIEDTEWYGGKHDTAFQHLAVSKLRKQRAKCAVKENIGVINY